MRVELARIQLSPYLKGKTEIHHRDLSIHIEGELSEIKLRPIYYWPKMGIVKTRKLDESKKDVFFCFVLNPNPRLVCH